MIAVTELQRKNAISAKEMWLSVPEENVSAQLGDWRYEPTEGRAFDLSVPATCNTIACFGGWCAQWPEFKAQGIYADSNGTPISDAFNRGLNVDMILFGDGSMFDPRQTWESKNKAAPWVSDWQVVMNRIDTLIECSIVKL